MSVLLLLASYCSFLILAGLIPGLIIRGGVKRHRLLMAACVVEFVAVTTAIVPFFAFDHVAGNTASGVFLAFPSTMAFVVVVATLAISNRPSGIMLVVALSSVAFIGLAILSYAFFYWITEPVYDSVSGDGLVAYQAIFCAVFVFHLVASLAVTTGLTRWIRAPVYPMFGVVLLTFALLVVPLLWALSTFNYCVTDVSFPIPGFTNCGDD